MHHKWFLRTRARISTAAGLATLLAATAVASMAATSAAPAAAAGDIGTNRKAPPASRASDPALPGEVLVKLARGDQLPGLLARYPLSLLSRFGARPIYRLKTVGAAQLEDVLAAMALDPQVQLAEANLLHRQPEARKNAAWAIGSSDAYMAQWAPQALRLPEAQARAGGAGVRVAVLDSGVDGRHPALAGRMLPGRDFVDGDHDANEVLTVPLGAWGHGTHVAGLVALAAPQARIMPLRVLDTQGNTNAWVLAEALLHAIDPDGNPATDDGAHIINLSLGSLQRTRLLSTITLLAACATVDPAEAGAPENDLSDPGYGTDRERCLQARGTLIVAAAGNDASSQTRQYPAAEGAYGLLSVGASNRLSRPAAFTNFGSWVDIAAPGEGLTSTLPLGLWGTWSGTSMAAPLVAGSAALVLSAAPQLSAVGLVKRLKRAATPLCGGGGLRQLDVYAAVSNTPPRPLSCP